MYARLLSRLAGLLLLGIAGTASAQMQLTAAGTADGFTLSTFVSGLPTASSSSNGCCGPFGTASTSAGTILVDSYDNSKVYVFKDQDGQTPSMATSSTTLQSFATALTNANGTIYASGGLGAPIGSAGSGPVGGPNAYNLLSLTNSGGVASTVATNLGAAGVATNYTNGHVLTEGATGFLLGIPQTETLYDVDPSHPNNAQFITSWSSTLEGDGVVVSA